MENNIQFWHIWDLESLWNFLFPENKLTFSKRQINYLAFGYNYHYYGRMNRSGQLSESKEQKNVQKKYKTYYIPKSNWKYRIIREPCDVLKQIQKQILGKLLTPYSESVLSDSCTWFRHKFSIVDNAQFHKNKDIVIKLDISDFFPSISQARVYWFFKNKFWFNHQISSYLSGLCTYKNELPQGAPTSPMIANIIGVHIDNRILKLVESLNQWNANLNLSYSRYADDMTFSYVDESLNPNKFINYIQSIIEWEWFFLNLRKIRLFRSSQKQEVTWIIVNGNDLSIGRKKYKLFRAIIHSIKNDWWQWALEKWNQKEWTKITDAEKFKQIIKGYHDYIFMIHKNWAHPKYLADFYSVLNQDWNL